ncbi:MAG: ribonuclease III [Oscillospiraceae bacterium]|nr:ribonuclease III [Oscillospiraceae bacterium]
MSELEEKLGYRFRDRGLLELALTHSSRSNELGKGHLGSNERLEFLGDSILGFVVAEALFRAFPDKPEGEMTRLRAELVCEGSLVRASAELGLGEELRLSRGEALGGGHHRPSMIADAFEAVLAAIYIDGGEEEARAFLGRTILPRLHEVKAAKSDYKTLLQEAVQRRGLPAPTYRLVGESGPDHHKTFTAQVLYGGKVAGEGSGGSKKEAEQAAAQAAYAHLPESRS